MKDSVQQLYNGLLTCKKAVFFGGAGVSTESGIPDFRSESGIYRTVQEYGVPPEEILSHTFFVKHPDIFYQYYRNYMLHPSAVPNAAHRGLAFLERQGVLTAVITQNIDGLHQRAGSRKVLELHGSIHRNYCMDCHQSFGLDIILRGASLPRCTRCGGLIKPDVVLYEEALDETVLSQSISQIQEADLMIVGGTSLNVYPAAGLLRYFHGDVGLVLINRDETPLDGRADLVIHHKIGEVFQRLLDFYPSSQSTTSE